MHVAPQAHDVARLERALDRLADHCESFGRMTARIEERRREVRAQLERELGPELVLRLLAGLASA